MNVIMTWGPMILLVAAMVYCATRESRVIAVYKRMKIFGRFKAYMAIDLVFGGAMVFVTGILAPLQGPMLKREVLSGYMSILGGAALFGAGCLIYANAYMKCPPSLKKKVIWDMTTAGWGIAIKIVLFFLPMIWRLADPRHVIYMPHQLRNTFTGQILTLKDTYDTVALYIDEHGMPVILDGIKESGNQLFETNQGLFERV